MKNNMPAIEKDKNILFNKIAFLSLLFSTLFVHIRVPFLKYAIYDYLLPLFALILAILNARQLKSVVSYHRKTLLLLIMLYVWMWITTYFSDFQDLSIKYSIKFTIYLILFFSFLLLTYKKQDKFIYYNLASRFLGFLALFGFFEYFFPTAKVFHFFRPLVSLNAFPHISSLMQWSNQFGVLMSIWALLTIILYKKKVIPAIEFYFSIILLIIIIPLSGSINAWFTLLSGICLACFYKTISIRRALIIVGLLSMSILFFPVSAMELGLNNISFPLLKNILNITSKQVDTKIHFEGKPTDESSPSGKNSVSPDTYSPDSQQHKIEAQTSTPEMTSGDEHSINSLFDKSLFKSFDSRKKLWLVAAKKSIDNPITGIGLQSFTRILVLGWLGGYNTHNIFLNVLVEFGIPGLLIAILFIYSLLIKAQWNDPIIIIPVIMIFAGQLVDYFSYDFTFTTLAIFFIAEAGNSKSKENN